MSHRFLILRAGLFLMGLVCQAGTPLAQKPLRIGMILDGPSRFNQQIIEVFQSEIKVVLEDENEVSFPADRILVGDWSASGIEKLCRELMDDNDVDLVIALGLISSHEFGHYEELAKPVFATSVLDPIVQGLPAEVREIDMLRPGETERYRVSGKKNLNYLLFGGSARQWVAGLDRLVPFSRLTVLMLEAWKQVVPGIEGILGEKLAPAGVERLDVVMVSRTVEDAVARIPSGTDVVVVSPLVQLSSEQFDRLVELLNERKLPTLSLGGREEVVRGLLATFISEDDAVRRARRVALSIQETLEGRDPGEMSIEFERDARTVINMATARQIGVSPRYSILLEAELLNESPAQYPRTLSLGAVVREASTMNLDLVAADRGVSAGEESVREARSPLFPQLGLSGGAAVIDADRARVLPTLGETQYSATLEASQLIYSDKAWAGYTIESNLQDLRIEERAQLRLDVVLNAGEGYLGLLRAQTIERLQKDNLALTRSNLQLASSRVAIGVAGREEVFRWESQMAVNQRDVVEAEALRNQARLEVNRVLNKPLGEQFGTVEAGLDDPELVANFQSLAPFIDNPKGFQLFADFMTEEAIAAAPELLQFDAAIRAKRREIDAAKRSFFLPDFALSGGLSAYQFHGVGSDLAPGLNNTDWFVAVSASLPLFEGGGRYARLSRASLELEQLNLQRQATSQRVEQRIRSILEAANASFIGIELFQAQAEAARQNLQLVTASYAAGTVGILDLLDAQNQALGAELGAANAVFKYLGDLMAVQRAVGRFDYFRTPQERQEFLARLEKYFRDRAVPVRRN